ncbi:hypothetical protein pb186bvf_016420 [Paramecium bursaria]
MLLDFMCNGQIQGQSECMLSLWSYNKYSLAYQVEYFDQIIKYMIINILKVFICRKLLQIFKCISYLISIFLLQFIQAPILIQTNQIYLKSTVLILQKPKLRYINKKQLEIKRKRGSNHGLKCSFYYIEHKPQQSPKNNKICYIECDQQLFIDYFQQSIIITELQIIAEFIQYNNSFKLCKGYLHYSQISKQFHQIQQFIQYILLQKAAPLQISQQYTNTNLQISESTLISNFFYLLNGLFNHCKQKFYFDLYLYILEMRFSIYYFQLNLDNSYCFKLFSKNKQNNIMQSQPPKQEIRHASTFNFSSSYNQPDTGNRVAPQKSNIIYPRQTTIQVYPETIFKESVIVPERPMGIERALEQKTTQPQQSYPQRPVNDQKQPIDIQCPYCKGNITTNITYEVGDGTQCAAITLLILFFPLFWLPLVKKECKNIIHRCPRSNCGKELGRADFKFC